MRLLIVPGLSSPHCDQQKPVYGPLLHEANRRLSGVQAEIVLMPGQLDDRGYTKGEFLIPDCVNVLRSVVNASEDREQLLIIARSSGCTVVAELLATWKESPVSRVVFWGPPPFWLYHDMFAAGEGAYYEKARKTGVTLTRNILNTCSPWESNLSKFPQRLLLATGADDIFCPPTYLHYIVTSKKTRVPALEYGEVPNCPHGPTPEMTCWQEYCECIFGWLSSDEGATLNLNQSKHA